MAVPVARLGTVSAAAETLGLHRATIVRHVDTLEAALGGRLFHRHARGYTPTEGGADMLRVAQATSEQFSALRGRVRGGQAKVTGELVVTSIDIVAPLVLPGIARFRAAHPETPLYAHRRYLDAHGAPDVAAGLEDHDLVVDTRRPVAGWMAEVGARGRVVFESGDDRMTRHAVRAGLGVGFFPVAEARCAPDLVEVCPPREDWRLDLWLVTHVDLHTTAKVRALTRALRADEAAP